MKIVTFLTFACLSGIQCSKILLVFPFPATSHYILGSALARGLAKAGHDVTLVSPFEDKNESYRNIALNGILEEHKKTMAVNMFRLENMSPISSISATAAMGNAATLNTFEHPNFQKLINSNEQFHAVIVEIFVNDAFNGLAHYFKAPLILLSPIGPNGWVNPSVGNPSPPSYVPESILKYTSDMTFDQRMINWFYSILSQLHRNLVFLPFQNELMKKYLPGVPDLTTINYNVSLVLLNSHESVNQALPHVPCMIDIGGYHVNPPRNLPRDLKEFMDNATEGVVYFSMGSNIKPSDMPEEKREAILKALGKIKQKVLWKWDQDTLRGKPDNVKISKWFPQQDILAHPNVRLFITHGGLLSTTETIYHGVPILVFPIFGDQKMNGARAEMNGFGVSVPFSEITEEKLTNALDKLLLDPIYRNNAKWRSNLLHDRPVKPMDLAIYWVEFIIRHQGAPHLRVAGLDLPWYKYVLLDVIAFVLLVNIAIITMLYVIIKKICKRNTGCSKVKRN